MEQKKKNKHVVIVVHLCPTKEEVWTVCLCVCNPEDVRSKKSGQLGGQSDRYLVIKWYKTWDSIYTPPHMNTSREVH